MPESMTPLIILGVVGVLHLPFISSRKKQQKTNALSVSCWVTSDNTDATSDKSYWGH